MPHTMSTSPTPTVESLMALADAYAFARVVAAGCSSDRYAEAKDRFVEKRAALEAALSLLMEDAARTGRNRDMWKGQCERQAEQLDALRKDAGRLDWLERDFYVEERLFRGGKALREYKVWEVNGDMQDNIRAAIDAAIAKEKT